MGTASLVLGIVSLFLGWIPIFGQLLAVLAVIFGALRLRRGSMKRGQAITGFVLGLLALVEGILVITFAFGAIFTL
ncbi:MAG: hypothetical protein K9L68_04420 [Spirochaetales bacterium]|nr:hypothetical protein [Spirochaetales bacterium]MCF7937822.1 hypothetical protein [Spirochaetales bacterium]